MFISKLMRICVQSKTTGIRWLSPPTRTSNNTTSSLFNRNSCKLFKTSGEVELPGSIHDVDLFDEGLIVMGVNGFQLVDIDQ